MLEPKTTVKVADSLRHAIMERVPGTIPIKEMHQAVMERTLIATPSEQTTDTKASLIAAINNHLMAMPEAALQNLLDSLG
jgi:hypothetical protein